MSDTALLDTFLQTSKANKKKKKEILIKKKKQKQKIHLRRCGTVSIDAKATPVLT